METKAYCSSKPTKRYRSRSGTAHTRLRSLSCPSCGWHRLIDTGNRTVSRTYSPGDPGYACADYRNALTAMRKSAFRRCNPHTEHAHSHRLIKHP